MTIPQLGYHDVLILHMIWPTQDNQANNVHIKFGLFIFYHINRDPMQQFKLIEKVIQNHQLSGYIP